MTEPDVAVEGSSPDPISTPLAGYAHTHLRDRIVSGEFAPHAVLSEAQLARSLGISRGPIREAIRRLQEQGLVVTQANRRPRVAGFDPDSLDSLYGARIGLEALGASVTARAATDELIVELWALLDEMDGADDGDPAWRQAHRAFHGAVVGGAGIVFREQAIALAERSEPYYHLYGGSAGPGRADHVAVIHAIEARDPHEAMRRHGLHVARTALSVLAVMAPEYEPVTIRASLQMLGLSDTPAP